MLEIWKPWRTCYKRRQCRLWKTLLRAMNEANVPRQVASLHMWDLDASLGSRLTSLANPPSFQVITESIMQSMRILCRHENQCDEDNRFFRPVYCIHIGKRLFDLFFNSAEGYRAWYYRSPCQGLEMNSMFIDSLRPAFETKFD